MNPNTSDATPVWANHPSTPLVHALEPWQSSTDLADLRLTVEMRNRVGDIKFQAFIQYADDPMDPTTWSTPTAIGALLSANGTSSSAWTSVTSGKKRFYRTGVRAVNDSSTSLNLAHAILRKETRS